MTINQTLFTKGIYEFEDPAGTLIAAKSPFIGTADLYDGTVVIVKPNQCAMFIYQGKIADILLAGTHIIKTANLPIISRLANWRFGFNSPLRCEIWFFSGNAFTARRWGTSQPVVIHLDSLGAVPIRSYGNYNLVVREPQRVYETLIGSKNMLDVTEVEEFVQGQIVELLPESLKQVKKMEELGTLQNVVSKHLEQLISKEISQFGIQVQKIQVLSMIPPKEVFDALDARAAMQVIGNQKEYLIYKAANSLDAVKDNNSNDSMQMMLGLMLGKGLMGADFHQKEALAAPSHTIKCLKCSSTTNAGAKFCSNCGEKV
jgi:membrane protease subunit (stomatin/prohibitin family)